MPGAYPRPFLQLTSLVLLITIFGGSSDFLILLCQAMKVLLLGNVTLLTCVASFTIA